MRILALLSALAIVQPGAVQRGAAPLPSGTSTIAGVLTDALSKEPLKGCIVTVARLDNFRPSSGATTISGPDGTYSFVDIAAGDYALNATCTGYLPTCYRSPGVDPPRCDTVGLLVDQRNATLDFRIAPGAIARGRVVDANGRPIRGATVRLGMPVRDQPMVMNKPAQTDRDGLFELSGLAAGEWRLEVELPAPTDAPRPPIIYFPGVLAQSEAAVIELVAGHTLDDVVVVVPALDDNRLTVRLVTLEQKLLKVDLALVRVEPLMSRRITVDDAGAGTVTGLVPGRYFLSARGYSEDRLSVAYDVVEFAGDSHETLLYLQPPARITGRVTGDRGAAPSLEGVRVGAVWIHDGVEVNPMSVDEAAVAEDGTFRFDGLFGTRQLRLFGLDPEFEVRSILQGRTDVTASGVALMADAEVKVVVVVGRR
jgi:hypothetical protein